MSAAAPPAEAVQGAADTGSEALPAGPLPNTSMSVAAPAGTAVEVRDVDDTPAELRARKVDLYWSAAMVALLAVMFLLLTVARGVAVPVLLAFMIAYATNPVVTWLQRRRVARTVGTAMVFGVMGIMLAGFVLYLVPVVGDQFERVPQFLASASTSVTPWVERTFGVSLPALVHERTQELGGEIEKLFGSVGPGAATLLASFAGNTARFIATVLGFLVVPVLGFFFLADYPHIIDRFRSLIPFSARPLVQKRFQEVDEVLSAFVRGQLTVASILSAIYITGLSVARAEMAIFIGLVAGFGNLVPYLGTALGLVLSLFGVALAWQGSWQLAVVGGTFLLAQILEGTVITPRVVGNRVGLPPVVIIIAVLAFAEAFGFVGVLLAVPSTAVLKVVLNVVVARYKRSMLYRRGAEVS